MTVEAAVGGAEAAGAAVLVGPATGGFVAVDGELVARVGLAAAPLVRMAGWFPTCHPIKRTAPEAKDARIALRALTS